MRRIDPRARPHKFFLFDLFYEIAEKLILGVSVLSGNHLVDTAAEAHVVEHLHRLWKYLIGIGENLEVLDTKHA